MTAREFFEGISRTSTEREKTVTQLHEIESRLTAPSSPSVGGTSRSRTPRGIDDRLASCERRRSLLRKRLGRLDNQIMQAENLLYDDGGLCDHLSDVYCDLVYSRYFEGMQWKQIARRFDMCVTTSRGMVNTALSTIDELGLIDRFVLMA